MSSIITAGSQIYFNNDFSLPEWSLFTFYFLGFAPLKYFLLPFSFNLFLF
jgi:hypothetical protein